MLIIKHWGYLNRIILSRVRNIHTSLWLLQDEGLSDAFKDLDIADSEYNRLSSHYFYLKEAHRCLIIQPYVKWGPRKLSISPQEQLSEAIALIRSLPAWTVEETLTIPLDNLDRKTLFKSGSMQRLRDLVQEHGNISAIFVNHGALRKATVQVLQENLQRPILDRYNIVMQILKVHATSKHAKLQVALAELYYVQRKSERDLIFRTYNSETLRLMFQEREKRIKNEINTLRNQRSLLRNKRKKLDYPMVAVVGYTNAGKTSVIKSLTGEESLKPKNQLFATLDVTVHKGMLPSGLDVLYVDTVGFISDIPTNLIECFVATLEDALLADVILHIEDISSESYEYKRNHVLQTLEQLERQTETKNVLSKVISVGNKSDLINRDNVKDQNLLLVSTENGIGLEDLRRQLEDFVLYVTGRQKITIRIPNGGEEIRWLYKNATVLEEIPDQEDLQFIFAKVIITQGSLNKFKHTFI